MTGTSILEHFAPLSDPRIARGKADQLLDIVVLAICAVVSDAEGWDTIAEFGHTKLTCRAHNETNSPTSIPRDTQSRGRGRIAHRDVTAQACRFSQCLIAFTRDFGRFSECFEG